MSDTRLKLLTATTLLTFLGLVTSIAGLHPGDAELSEPSDALKFQQRPPELNKEAASWRQSPATTGKPLAKPPNDLQACSTAPDRKRAVLSRQASTSSQKKPSSNATAPRYWPRQAKALAYSTNYGDRLIKDVYGRPVNNQLLVVLHETVGSAAATIRFFQTPHYQDSEQASYHAMVTLDGTIVYLLPPEKRAFGAGNSVFVGLDGPETVKTKLDLLPSV
ncbi:MAG TPA: peptidoglycan recognition family protein, partial [Candidatus Caenarcaniphilales bacterium]